MKDFLGQTLEEGDIFLYPTTSMSTTRMNAAVVNYIDNSFIYATRVEVVNPNQHIPKKNIRKVKIEANCRTVKVQPNMLNNFESNNFDQLIEEYHRLMPEGLNL